MGRAKQTLARLIDQRARRRATSRLIKAHQQEWDGYYEVEAALAETEAELIAERSRAQHPSHPSDPPRLQPGRRLEGQTPVDRIDVARCETCIQSHDRGHVCPKCGRIPQLHVAGKSREVHRLAAAGTSVDIIATTLRIPPDHVRRLLDLPAS